LSYGEVVEQVSSGIDSIKDGQPVRVAIDGRTASGKSTFARALSAQLMRCGRSVVHTTIDGFHNPKTIRYARGRMSAEGYYHDARDLAAVRRELLDPLGPGGTREIRTHVFDLEADVPSIPAVVRFAETGVLVVDGTFLARPELASAWDIHVFLKTSRQTARFRGVTRDVHLGVSTEQAEAMFDNRYLPAFEMYVQDAKPESQADVIIELEDFASPRIVRAPKEYKRKSTGLS
jgi:uridine kinase